MNEKELGAFHAQGSWGTDGRSISHPSGRSDQRTGQSDVNGQAIRLLPAAHTEEQAMFALHKRKGRGPVIAGGSAGGEECQCERGHIVDFFLGTLMF